MRRQPMTMPVMEKISPQLQRLMIRMVRMLG